MIVKNEEEVLEDCLRDAAGFADEIIIADTGSADATKRIAERYTGKVYDFAWCDDFAAARNFSYDKASCDYIMWLDADDRVTPENAEKIRAWKAGTPSVKLVLAGYERPENGGTYLYPRIVRRDAGFRWEGIIHEHLTLPKGSAELKPEESITADFAVRHCKQGEPDYARNLAIMEKLPEEELLRSFWLCANCFLDCILADEPQKAERYLTLAERSGTPFSERLKDFALINTVLKHHKQFDAMMKWNAMYLRCKSKNESRP